MNPRFLAYRRAPHAQLLKGFSDEELAELIAQGHEEAFEALVTRHRRVLLNHCSQLVGRTDAEEAVQETLLRAYLSLSRGHSVQRVSAWLRTIAHNTALNLLRARGARPAPAEREASDAASDPFEGREQLRLVLDALGSLPERQREALIMREWEGRSYAEIESRLQTSNGAVRQLLNRARARLRTRLGALAGIEPVLRWIVGSGSTGSNAVRLGALGGGCAVTVKLCAAALLPAGLAPGPSTATQAARPPHHLRAAAAAHQKVGAMNRLPASGAMGAVGAGYGSRAGSAPHSATVYIAYHSAGPWTRIGMAGRTPSGGPATARWSDGTGGARHARQPGGGGTDPQRQRFDRGWAPSGQAPSGSREPASGGGPYAYSAGAGPSEHTAGADPSSARPGGSAIPGGSAFSNSRPDEGALTSLGSSNFSSTAP